MSRVNEGSPSPDDIATLRQKRWRAQRAYVIQRSPFLARLWGDQEVPERLEDLPALPFCDKGMLRESQSAHPPFGDYLAAAPERVVRLHRTSGTTGQAMNIAQTEADAAQTAEVREKPAPKPKAAKPKRRKRGRPRKGEARAKEPSRLERQLTMSLPQMLADLPRACDVGSKRNAKGGSVANLT